MRGRLPSRIVAAMILLLVVGGLIFLMTMTRSEVVIEAQGKRNAAETATVEALAARYGDDQVRIRALEKHRVDDQDLVRAFFPEFEDGAVGCIIVVTAGDEGAVFVEDGDLRIIHEESLATFIQRASRVDPDLVSAFYLALA